MAVRLVGLLRREGTCVAKAFAALVASREATRSASATLFASSTCTHPHQSAVARELPRHGHRICGITGGAGVQHPPRRESRECWLMRGATAD